MDIDPNALEPLSLDRVMEGFPIAARASPLFQLPLEIITIITAHLARVASKADLASLALVNSACRQLARSCQFRSIHLDASPRAYAFLETLQREAIQRDCNRGEEGHTRRQRQQLSLGICIRHVKASDTGYRAERRRLASKYRGWDQKSKEQRSETLEDDRKLSERLREVFMPTLLWVIRRLIYVESLDLSFPKWTQDIFNCVTTSRVCAFFNPFIILFCVEALV